ncbi:hypothetical protein KM043_012118 [Ampulex compressa]|nr:hypothetical protein KM043_012118 [Ampulex compressa]
MDDDGFSLRESGDSDSEELCDANFQGAAARVGRKSESHGGGGHECSSCLPESGFFEDRAELLGEASMLDTPFAGTALLEIKYYKYEKSRRLPGPRAFLSAGLISASGLILLQIKGLGQRRLSDIEGRAARV